ncbi:hypothetical protein ACIRF8_07440 [Streptomyces sp. NPDC102406]|uniref:hypothetical protein n=1 Tax=Streptomyces sp. NPDC102406 TaxID=3366171 RepID=UPI0037FDAD5E
MTGIGPVEPYEPPDDPLPLPRPRTDTLDANTPRLSERWAALPVRRRRAALLLVCCAAAVGALLVLRPTSGDTTPPPWPASVTTLRYHGPGTDNGTFRFTLHVTPGNVVTVHQLQPQSTEFGSSTTPRLPLKVEPRSPRRLTVWLSVYTCTGLPPDAALHRLDAVLRNERGRQRRTFTLGTAFADDLRDFLYANCGPALPPELTRR